MNISNDYYKNIPFNNNEDLDTLKEFNNILINLNLKKLNTFSSFFNKAFELNKQIFDYYCNNDLIEDLNIPNEELELEIQYTEDKEFQEQDYEEIEILIVDKKELFDSINNKLTDHTIYELTRGFSKYERTLDKFINNNKSIAEFILGYHYKGIGVTKDLYMKYKLYHKSAENDKNFLAQFCIGFTKLKIIENYIYNEEIENSMNYYLQKSYNNGYDEAGYQLCRYLITKQFKKHFYFTEFQWKFVNTLSETNIKTNLFLMDVYSLLPDMSNYHESKILSHYYKAIELDSLVCHNIMGSIYYRKKDYTRAFAYYKKGSEIGDFCSSYNIGFMYYVGQEVDKNVNIAIKYFKLSLEQFEKYDLVFKKKYPLFRKEINHIIQNEVFIKKINIDEKDTCCICFNSFVNNNEKILVLECGHFFHVRCVVKCDCCPICRHVFE